MSRYEPAEMAGVVNVVKGKLFERLVEKYENAGDDSWLAVLHEDESYPGSDVILVNEETGETIELFLKTADSQQYLEDALLRYRSIRSWRRMKSPV